MTGSHKCLQLLVYLSLSAEFWDVIVSLLPEGDLLRSPVAWAHVRSVTPPLQGFDMTLGSCQWGQEINVL